MNDMKIAVSCAVLVLGVMPASSQAAQLGAGAGRRGVNPRSLGARSVIPSTPGPGIDRILHLRDNSWLDLGVPAPDPVYGLATGRSYTPRMAWAPDLRGAFLTGEGTHGYVIPDTGRYVDDVWFYDIDANRWLCVKPGSDVAQLRLRLNAAEFEVDRDGELVPVAQLGHGYELITYDSQARSFFMLSAPNTYWLGPIPQRLAWLGNAMLPASQVKSPWVFNTMTGYWERHPAGPVFPSFNVAARSMVVHYVPSQLGIWVWDTGPANRDKVWYFDTLGHQWSRSDSVTSAPVVLGNGVSCFDHDQERIYYFAEDGSGVHRLWYYDVATRTWNDTQANNTPTLVGVPIYTTGFAGLTYDSRSRVLLLKIHLNTGVLTPRFYVYDIATNAWRASPIEVPLALRPYFIYASVNAFYAPPYNAHFFHVSGEGHQTGRVVVYRYAN